MLNIIIELTKSIPCFKLRKCCFFTFVFNRLVRGFLSFFKKKQGARTLLLLEKKLEFDFKHKIKNYKKFKKINKFKPTLF
jgi:hypothetical protein